MSFFFVFFSFLLFLFCFVTSSFLGSGWGQGVVVGVVVGWWGGGIGRKMEGCDWRRHPAGSTEIKRTRRRPRQAGRDRQATPATRKMSVATPAAHHRRHRTLTHTHTLTHPVNTRGDPLSPANTPVILRSPSDN